LLEWASGPVKTRCIGAPGAPPAKIADMIFISSRGICGEDDVRGLREREARTSQVSERNYSG
jgi:hypothetical protein